MYYSVDGRIDTDGRTSFTEAQPLSRASFLPEYFLSLTIINLFQILGEKNSNIAKLNWQPNPMIFLSSHIHECLSATAFIWSRRCNCLLHSSGDMGFL